MDNWRLPVPDTKEKNKPRLWHHHHHRQQQQQPRLRLESWIDPLFSYGVVQCRLVGVAVSWPDSPLLALFALLYLDRVQYKCFEQIKRHYIVGRSRYI